jgi:hypothetical protein
VALAAAALGFAGWPAGGAPGGNGPRAYADSVNVDLDQCANDTTPCTWQNGNLHPGNSSYAEGDVVPFRLAIEGLEPGEHTIHLNYDFTEGGHKAYDFLATYNATETVDLCGAGGGGVSSLCPTLPAASSMGFPSDTETVDGLPVSGAESHAALGRVLKLYGGTITDIATPDHSGPSNHNSKADIVVTFEMDDEGDQAALFAWGGHIAQSSYWDVEGDGDPDGASYIEGSPWHMRTQSLDDSGHRNQDRSIQIGGAGETTPTHTPTPTPTNTPTDHEPTDTPTNTATPTRTNTPAPHVHTHTPTPHAHTATSTATAVPPTATNTPGAGVLAAEATPKPAGAVLPAAGTGGPEGNSAVALLVSAMAGTGLLLLEAARRLWSRRRG